MKNLKFIAAVLLLTIGWLKVEATHLRAGEIIVRPANGGCGGREYEIIIKVYTNTGSDVRFEGGKLTFGDGDFIITPRVENTPRPDLGPGIAYVEFKTNHTYRGSGRYTITYTEKNRNAGILNIDNSVGTPFSLETSFVIDATIGCNSSPVLNVAPIDKGCLGVAWFHNPGAVDPDRDSLSYALTVPKQFTNIPVFGYRPPNSPEFYAGKDYSKSNEQGTGEPVFKIDSVGTITWNAPGTKVGEYNIAFTVYQWHKVGTKWKQIGYVTRDMQIIIENCLNQRPDLPLINRTCVIAEVDPPISKSVIATDPDAGDNLKIEAFSEVFTLPISPATYSPKPPVFTSNPAQLDFNWTTKCEHISNQDYDVVFKVTDKPPVGAGPSLIDFTVWKIYVMGPKPQIKPLVTNVNDRSVVVGWMPYLCARSAISMEIWRRVDSFTGVQAECETGMPASFGYTKIKTVPITDLSYKDEDLAAGAKYCYRLVAVFPGSGGVSKVSDEECMQAEFKVDRPIITKVSIDETGVSNGKATVSWVQPLDLPAQQFSYEVYRSEGFSGNINFTKVTPGKVTTTSISDEGINTKDKIYNYSIKAFAESGAALQTSASASTVRLEISAKIDELQLTWAAFVPWSNSVSNLKHKVYKKLETDPDFVDPPIEVNPGQGFKYSDKNVEKGKTYCYRVETVGSYGSTNPAIPTTLTNFSQIICAQVDDKIKPCKPEFSVELKGTDCSINQTCTEGSIFSNKLTWNAPVQSCKQEIKYYVIYYSTRVGSQFDSLTSVAGTVTDYEDKNLLSNARCYKIKAVDRAGNESQLSQAFCFDNCPNYELPNVFTPNGDKCNDKFSAYNIRNIIANENGIISECGVLTTDQLEQIQQKCARHVEKVLFTVFNRWGGEVFSYESGNERSIYIDWDGRDNSGRDLAAGVYYYEALVTFDVVDPSKRNKTIRGWVQIVR